MPPRKLVLDTNCFIDASRDDASAAAYASFADLAAPRLHLSSVVAAELRAGAIDAPAAKLLEEEVLLPYQRRGRVIIPSPTAWRVLGSTLATLLQTDGLELRKTRRSFIFDVLIAYSCRESGAILVSRNARDLNRIAGVFGFDFVAPFPDLAAVQ